MRQIGCACARALVRVRALCSKISRRSVGSVLARAPVLKSNENPWHRTVRSQPELGGKLFCSKQAKEYVAKFTEILLLWAREVYAPRLETAVATAFYTQPRGC